MILSVNNNERIHLMPMIIEDLMVSEEPQQTITPFYFYREGEDVFYPGMIYDRAFIYVGEHKAEKIMVKKIGGIDHVFINDIRLVPIRGIVYGIIGNGRNIAIAAKLRTGEHAYTILEDKNVILEMAEYKVGLFSKKKCSLTRIDFGLAGGKIFAVVRGKSGREDCPDLLVYEKSSGKYVVKQMNRLIPVGWNGEWFSYADISEKNIEFHIINYRGKEEKRRIPRSEFPSSFLIPGSLSYFRDSIGVFNNSYEIIGYDFNAGSIRWRKSLGDVTFMPKLFSLRNDLVLAYTSKTLCLIDPRSGDEKLVFNPEYRITSAIIDGGNLFVGSEDLLEYYRVSDGKLEPRGRYSISGVVNGLNALENYLLISYQSPGKIVKLIYADYSESLRITIPTFKITSGSNTEYEFREATPRIRVVRQIGPQIVVLLRGSKLIIADRGSKPGKYTGTLEIETLGYLPIIDDVTVVVEKLETVFKKIKMHSRIVTTRIGPYIPVIIEPIVDLDEVYVVVHSSDHGIYGTSHVLYNVPKKETVIPVYILWAKQGIHSAELFISAWNRRNLFRENFSSKIVVEYDVPPFFLRVTMDTARIWSPFPVEAARITFEAPNSEFTVIHDLKEGWNEMDTHGLIPRRVRITLRSGITYIVERGSSWIQLASSST
jgi:hypothetical protein